MFCLPAAAIAMLIAATSFNAGACSDVVVKGDKGIVVSARTMDFDIDLKSAISLVPRGQKITSNAPEGKKGLTWTSRYGFVGVKTMGLEKYCDGLNEQGLSVGLLWLAESRFPEPASSRNALSIQDAAAWVLGNFSTVEEVRAALGTVTVWGELAKEINMVPPLHLAVHDALGNNLAVEFVKGAMTITDNPNGVMTNSPPFDWHLENIGHAGAIEALGGSGNTHGMPGDSSSASRFVRLTQLKNAAPKPGSAREAVQFATYLINRVNVVPGEKKAKAPNPLMPYKGDYTQWTVVRDHGSRVYYYKTMFNNTLRSIDLNKVSFTAKQPIRSLSMEDDQAEWSLDVKDKFR